MQGSSLRVWGLGCLGSSLAEETFAGYRVAQELLTGLYVHRRRIWDVRIWKAAIWVLEFFYNRSRDAHDTTNAPFVLEAVF